MTGKLTPINTLQMNLEALSSRKTEHLEKSEADQKEENLIIIIRQPLKQK